MGHQFDSPFLNGVYSADLVSLRMMLVNITVCNTSNEIFRSLTISYLLYVAQRLLSLFISYRLTGDDRYRECGWKIFQSIEKYCRLESGGYASILNVDDVDSEKMDKMETFFLV